MRSSHVWTDTIVDKTQTPLPIYAVTILSPPPPSTPVAVVSAGPLILLYDLLTGSLLDTLKGHKDTIYSLSASNDASKLASSSADKSVILWQRHQASRPTVQSVSDVTKVDDTWAPMMKYSHGSSVEVVCWNPRAECVASCSSSEVGVWTGASNSVTKYKVRGRVCTASWSPDGHVLALGFFDGSVSFLTRTGEERVVIKRSESPVWALSFTPPTETRDSVLVVTDWDRNLAIYQKDGTQIGRDRQLKEDVTSVSFYQHGDYLVMGGSSQTVSIWTKEGVSIPQKVCNADSWVWSTAVSPSNHVLVGCENGTVSVYQTQCQVVHALYGDRYVYRDNLTDVIIHNLTSDLKARIKCRDYVSKVAVFTDRLVVQLSDRIIVYELIHDEPTDMHYRIREKLAKKFDCNLLVCTSNHLVLCMDNILRLMTFTGTQEREWPFEAPIRFIKCIGGASNHETLVVGLKNGSVVLVCIDSPFPRSIVTPSKLTQSTSIRCLDVNNTRSLIAVIDDQSCLNIYSIRTGVLVYQDINATSVSFNAFHPNMVAYSANGTLRIQLIDTNSTYTPTTVLPQPILVQKIPGSVIAFRKASVFSLSSYSVSTTKVSYVGALEKVWHDLDKAYEVASLGVAETEWRELAQRAMTAMQFGVAKKAFSRIRDVRGILLVDHLEKMKSMGVHNVDLLMADMNAFQGRFQEAAKLYKKGGLSKNAIDMYTDLGMWEQATQLAKETNTTIDHVLKRKAEMLRDKNQLSEAVNVYLQIGDYHQTISLLDKMNDTERLLELMRSLNKVEDKALLQCANVFRSKNKIEHAAEALMKLGQIQGLMDLYISLDRWDEALHVAEMYPDVQSKMYLPYAKHLAETDRFSEAQTYFRKAGRSDMALQVVQRLCDNAIIQERFSDASYYHWLIAQEHLSSKAPTSQIHRHFSTNLWLAETYYSYAAIHQYIMDPFTPHPHESLLNMARFLLTRLTTTQTVVPVPPGISLSIIYFALGKLSLHLTAYKTSFFAFSHLRSFNTPLQWDDTIELGVLLSKSKPMSDPDDLLPVCYHCSATNPIVPFSSDCVQCGQPFVVSYHTFDSVPLVKVTPESGVSDREAVGLVKKTNGGSNLKKWVQENDKGESLNSVAEGQESVDRMVMVDQEEAHKKHIESTLIHPDTVLSRAQLAQLSPNEICIVDYGHPAIPVEFYQFAIPDVQITQCSGCQKHFHTDDFEFLVLQHNGACPFCRTKVEVQ